MANVGIAQMADVAGCGVRYNDSRITATRHCLEGELFHHYTLCPLRVALVSHFRTHTRELKGE